MTLEGLVIKFNYIFEIMAVDPVHCQIKLNTENLLFYGCLQIMDLLMFIGP